MILERHTGAVGYCRKRAVTHGERDVAAALRLVFDLIVSGLALVGLQLVGVLVITGRW